MRWFMLKYCQLFLQDITALLYIKRRREQKLDIRFLTFSEIEVFGKHGFDVVVQSKLEIEKPKGKNKKVNKSKKK